MCASDLYILTFDNEEFVPPWRHGWYDAVEEIGINCCSQEVTAYFTSASVTNFFPAKCFLRNTYKRKSLAARSGLQGQKGGWSLTSQHYRLHMSQTRFGVCGATVSCKMTTRWCSNPGLLWRMACHINFRQLQCHWTRNAEGKRRWRQT
jgi:hypothetical protein